MVYPVQHSLSASHKTGYEDVVISIKHSLLHAGQGTLVKDEACVTQVWLKTGLGSKNERSETRQG